MPASAIAQPPHSSRPVADQDPARAARSASPAAFIASGPAPSAQQRALDRADRPHQPVHQEVADAQQEARALARRVGIEAAARREREDGHRRERRPENGREHDQRRCHSFFLEPLRTDAR